MTKGYLISKSLVYLLNHDLLLCLDITKSILIHLQLQIILHLTLYTPDEVSDKISFTKYRNIFRNLKTNNVSRKIS